MPDGVCVLDGVPNVVGVDVGVFDKLAIDVPVTCEVEVKKADGRVDNDGSDVNLALRVLRRPVNDAIDDDDKMLVTDNDGKLLADILRDSLVDLVTDRLAEVMPDTVAGVLTVIVPVINEVDVIKIEKDDAVVREATLDMVGDIELTGVFV